MNNAFLAYRQYHRQNDDARRSVNGYTSEEFATIQAVECSIRIVVSMAIGLYLCDRWRRMTKMLLASGKLEGRGEHNIITDFTGEKRVMEICETMDRRISRFWQDGADILMRLDFWGADTHTDRTEQWECMVETAREIFDRPMALCLKLLKKNFKQSCSPYDTVAFYRAMELLFLSGVFENLISSFSGNMSPDELKPFRALQPTALALELTKCMKLRDTDGKIMAFAYLGEERKMETLLRTKKFYLKSPCADYRLYYPTPVFQSEDLARGSYELEKVIFAFDTIRRIREAAGAANVNYERLFKMRYDCMCMESFEQYMIVLAMKQKNYAKALDYVRRMRTTLPIKRNGKPTSPVACFIYISPSEMDKFYDKAKSQGAKPKRREHSILEFKGVWQSASEASRECGASFFDISNFVRKNNREKEAHAYHTKHCHLWLSLNRFEKILEKLVENETKN